VTLATVEISYCSYDVVSLIDEFRTVSVLYNIFILTLLMFCIFSANTAACCYGIISAGEPAQREAIGALQCLITDGVMVG